MEGHAPCRVECPRRRRWPAGCRCPEPEDAPEGSRSVPAGAVLVASGAFSTTRGLGCPRVRSGRRTVGCAGDGSRGRLSARMERRGRGRDGLWDRLPARGLAGQRRGASATGPGVSYSHARSDMTTVGTSRRAELATPWGLTLIVTTRPHRKDVTGVPGQESLEHQSPERRGHPSRGAMDRQALSRRYWRSHRRDWDYPAAAAAGCCCYCCCCHRLYRRRP